MFVLVKSILGLPELRFNVADTPVIDDLALIAEINLFAFSVGVLLAIAPLVVTCCVEPSLSVKAMFNSLIAPSTFTVPG
ncbi:MAG: hypothetical protein SPLUMA1_SPLUMAMAG1_01944 [uncultured Sulfurimonas sp.]|nr:MAG: hypothetical protein SPLUMA1_SPLUMAMAG1_01944 [uncultured Sulfurimonas sp.]